VVDGDGQDESAALRVEAGYSRRAPQGGAGARHRAAGDATVPGRQGDPWQGTLGIECRHAKHLRRRRGLKACRIEEMPRPPDLERCKETPEARPGSELRKERCDRHGVPSGPHTMSRAPGATGTLLPRGGSIDRWTCLRVRS